MATKTFELRVNAPIDRVWKFYTDEHAASMLAPTDRNVEVITKVPIVRNGATHQARFRQFGLKFRFFVQASEVNPPHGFVYTAVKSPFKKWIHRHEFIPDEDGTIIRETVEYVVKGGPIGSLAKTLFVDEEIDNIFHYRHLTTIHFAEDHTVKLNEEAFEVPKHGTTDLY